MLQFRSICFNNYLFFMYLFLLYFINKIDNCVSFNLDKINPINFDGEQKLLIISFDAFRYDYFNRNKTPFMNEMRQTGVSVPYLKSVFPTKTFVNHHSIATGMYPGTHGVMGNTLYDPEKGQLTYGYDLFHYNENIIPIWTLNEQSGKHSGCMMWPGCNFLYQNVSTTYLQEFNMNISFNQRVDTALSWFNHPTKPANLVFMYFEEPDKHGHVYNPESDVMTYTIQKMDELAKYIIEKISYEKLDNQMNIIWLSDHGMDSVIAKNFIDLRNFLPNETFNVYGSSPVLQIVPSKENVENFYERLKNVSEREKTFNVYKPEELPKRWHTEQNRRIEPILVVANQNYGFQDLIELAKYYEKEYKIPYIPEQIYGSHGYDNEMKSMYAMFFATGPIFKKNFTLKYLENIDLYNLFAITLDLKAPSNNGTLENILDVFAQKLSTTPTTTSNASAINNTNVGIISGFIVFTIVMLISMFVIWKKRTKRVLSYSEIVDINVESEILLEST